MAVARKPTPASAWDSGLDDELVELPSGKTARLRSRLRAFAVLRSGIFTADHLNVFQRAQAGELDPAEDDLQTVAEVNDLLVQHMFVEPAVVVDGDAGEGAITIDQIGDDDMQFVIERAMGVVRDAASFRSERRGAGDGADSAGVADKPKLAARSGGRKPRSVAGGPGARGKAGRSGAGKR